MYISSKFRDTGLWIVFVSYCLLAAISQITHEPWGDELQTWNLIKGSGNLASLLANARYDGHPPVWYILLFFASQITHSLSVLKIIAFVSCGLVAFVFVFYSDFNILIKSLTLMGYYFLFEYGVFSRNYTLVVLFTFLLCVCLTQSFRYRYITYYIVLFLLSNSHLLAVFLALNFHIYFLLKLKNSGTANKALALHFFIGLLLICSSLVYVYSGAAFGSGLSEAFSKWQMGSLSITAQVPLRTFLTIQVWWNFHFWNTNALWEVCKTELFLKLFAFLVSFFCLSLTIIALVKSKRALLFFICNFSFIFLLAVFVPIINTRYLGFIYIGFLVSVWLNLQELELKNWNKLAMYVLLLLQIPGSIIALSRDWTGSFSQINEVKSLLEYIPKNKNLVCDYWGLNFLNATTNQAYYCVESMEVQSFLVLDKKHLASLSKLNRYSDGMKKYFENSRLKEVYFLTAHPPSGLNEIDSELNKYFQLKLVSAKTGSIEKFSDLFLYTISERK